MDYANLINLIVGGIIGAGSAILTSWLRNRSDERRHRRELVFRSAGEYFARACDMARSRGGQVMPFEDFLIYMSVLSERVIEQRVDKSSVQSIITDVDGVVEQMRRYRDQQEKDGRK